MESVGKIFILFTRIILGKFDSSSITHHLQQQFKKSKLKNLQTDSWRRDHIVSNKVRQRRASKHEWGKGKYGGVHVCGLRQ